MEERSMNEIESLGLITQMIQNARTNLRAKINRYALLLWGYVIVIVAMAVWLINLTAPFAYSSFLWFLIPLICYPAVYFLSKRGEVIPPSYIEKVIDYVTVMIGILCATAALSTIWVAYPVFFIEGLLISLWMFVLGLLIKYKPVIVGAVVGMALAHCLLFIGNALYHIPVFALIVVVAVLVPGHILKKHIDK